MGIQVSVSKQSLSTVQRAIAALVPAYRNRVKDVIAETALNIESTAKQLVRVDTGRLRSSIAAEFRPDGLGATVGSNLPYAASQEFGNPARPSAGYTPYLYPAFAAERQRFLSNLKRALIP